MLEIITNTPRQNSTSVLTMEGLFSRDVIDRIGEFQKGQRDYLIIRGMPTSEELPDTPSEIRMDVFPELEKSILLYVAERIGALSEKGVEHTIRFDLEGQGTNNETWHSHFQYSSSLFYCIRADTNAQTYFLAARDVISRSGELEHFLITPYAYIATQPPFALIEHREGYYIFSKYIFERSELEKYVKDLDLPDAAKMLKKITRSCSDPDFAKAASFLLTQMQDCSDYISYLPGDLVLVHEPRVIRYSPGYQTNIPANQARWLLAASVETNIL